MSETKKTPNPNGRKGSTEHQEKILEVAEEMKSRKLNVFFEYRINLFGKKKKSRFADVAGFDEDDSLKELHQIGVENKNETPVKRERDAMDDIGEAKGIRPIFHAYKTKAVLIFIVSSLVAYLLS